MLLVNLKYFWMKLTLCDSNRQNVGKFSIRTNSAVLRVLKHSLAHTIFDHDSFGQFYIKIEAMD